MDMDVWQVAQQPRRLCHLLARNKALERVLSAAKYLAASLLNCELAGGMSSTAIAEELCLESDDGSRYFLEDGAEDRKKMALVDKVEKDL